MGKYMPQDMFDYCAVAAARLKDLRPIERSVKELMDAERENYIDDGLEKDLLAAAQKIVKFIDGIDPVKGFDFILPQILYCIDNYYTSGKKRFLKGSLFNQQKTPLIDRVNQCLKNVMIYYYGTRMGKFPVALEKDLKIL